MKAVADTLAVARSNLIERVSRRAKSRRPYRKAGDLRELLALIRRLVDERPTYGYRRIRRLINRQRKANGKPPVNGKRVLRIMQANKLTLERHTGRRPGRTHDGVVIAGRSNHPLVFRSLRARLSSMVMRSCVCCLLSMPAIARLWAGWPPPPASLARWCAT